MKQAKIFYFTLTDEMRNEEKLDWFLENKIKDVPFEHIIPDKDNNWINLTENNWEELIPVANKETKLSKNKNEEKAIFKLFSNGIVTARDEWTYDNDFNNLEKKIQYFYNIYENEKKRWKESDKKERTNDFVDRDIKWTEELEAHMKKDSNLIYDDKNIVKSIYRPFILLYNYFDKIITHRIYQQNFIYPINNKNIDNIIISFSGIASSKHFQTLSSKYLPCFDLLEKSQCLPLYIYTESGERKDNITDWGLQQFRERYEIQEIDENSQNPQPPTLNPISKEDIFHYVYAVLHNPAYRKKYELNLKREFPRIPFYDDFWKWAEWGEKLMDLHINFETAEPYTIERIDLPWDKERTPKSKLTADKNNCIITLDEQTSLKYIPKEAWEYKLGNRTAIEWILDQYKEKTPKDPTIREKFKTYKFNDYKEKVIDLIKRVTTVSVETVRIVKEMEEV